MPRQALGFKEFEVPRFQDNRHMKFIRLSALRTDRLYPKNKYSRYSFPLDAESTPGPQCGRKNYVNKKICSETIGNQTHDLQASSAVPQPTAPPCVGAIMLASKGRNWIPGIFYHLWCSERPSPFAAVAFLLSAVTWCSPGPWDLLTSKQCTGYGAWAAFG